MIKRLLGATFGGYFKGYLKRSSPDMQQRMLWYATGAMSEQAKLENGILTMMGSLANIKKNGFSPKNVLDCGAYVGKWSTSVAKIFPSATFHLFEAQPQNAGLLREVVGKIGNGSRFYPAVLGPESGREVDYHIMGTGSSVLAEKTSFQREVKKLTMQSLDDLLKDADLSGGCLLKLDVQGYEIEVLKGARRVLSQVDVVLSEISLLEYNQGAPLFADVVAFLKDAGFLAYDICSQLRRDSDQTLFQTDIIFVREKHPLRAPPKYWLSSEKRQGSKPA